MATTVSRYTYVLKNELPELKPPEQWFDGPTYKRRVRGGSDKQYGWLLPFLPREVAQMASVRSALLQGPSGAGTVVDELRCEIKELRAGRQPYAHLLQALYNVAVMSACLESLAFEGVRADVLLSFVSLASVKNLTIYYLAVGYEHIEILKKEDIQWLVESFGEPKLHQLAADAFPQVRRDAVCRYCWTELRRTNEAGRAHGLPEKTMQNWLSELVRRNISYPKQGCEDIERRRRDAQKYLPATNIRLRKESAMLKSAWLATTAQFVVADLETTGLNPNTDEVLEFAAVRVESSGTILAEFSMLVRVSGPIPPVITRITGIRQADVDCNGEPLAVAMSAFVTFIGDSPVFFHHAPFDTAFLRQAGAQTRQTFANAVHDTLPLSREVWPSLRDHKLGTLAEHVGAAAPTHRGLADAKAALAVLLAARDRTAPAHSGRTR